MQLTIKLVSNCKMAYDIFFKQKLPKISLSESVWMGGDALSSQPYMLKLDPLWVKDWAVIFQRPDQPHLIHKIFPLFFWFFVFLLLNSGTYSSL